MGPRSIERGEEKPFEHWILECIASMGPRSIKRGEALNSGGQYSGMGSLQWGRAQLSAESGRLGSFQYFDMHASMGPRSIERGEGIDARGARRGLRPAR